jgi:hypothetical protein
MQGQDLRAAPSKSRCMGAEYSASAGMAVVGGVLIAGRRA